ncbi:two-component system, NarL family, sensor histidine kinase BarA [Thermoflexales bacterium]|nr:two-component system, NarL family, sensor histidine kinase BarA [Thermoflexales bacterium]
MSLRWKALLLTALTLVSLMLILALVSAAIWTDSATHLEQRDLQQNLTRVTTALSGELADLDRFAGDWAGWDDTYAFVADRNQSYIDSNLIDATFLKDKFNVILYVDVSGQVVYSKTFDLAQQKTIPASRQWSAYLPNLTNHPTIDSAISSFVVLDNRLVLVVARPILTSDYQGPIRGTLIMGRDFTDKRLTQLEQVTGLELAVHHPHDPQLPADFQQAYQALLNTQSVGHAASLSPTYSRPLDDYTIAGYILLPDVRGEPVLLLRAASVRTAYQNAQAAIRILLIYLLLLGFVFGALTLALIDRLLLRRLSRLETGVGQIAARSDFSARVPQAGQDELANLARSINGMLDALEHTQQENLHLYEATRRQLGELSLLHTAALATARSVSLDAALQEIALSAFYAFNAINAMVILCAPSCTELEIRASVGVSTEVLATRRLKKGEGIIGWVAETGLAALVNDVSVNPYYYQADVRTRAELCAPLNVGERVIGMINVESDQVNAFTTADLQLLQTLTHSLSTIIENLRLLEELRAANEQLTEVDRLKNRFVANMSHELRTPLNAILGFSELLNDEVPGPLNDEQRDYVQHIDTSGRHLLALINDILDLSKLQANRIELERSTTYLADLVAEAHTLVWPSAQRKQQIITIDVSPDLPSLYIDPLRIKQVLINLLNNACKFTPKGGHITVQAECWNADWLRISICDDGLGIPPERQAEVFEDFSQLDREQHGLDRGTGLGLAIARRLVELHGGQIWIESVGQPGLGSTFYFTLPLTEVSPAQPRTSTRLLIIDDDPAIIELLRSILRPPDYEVSGLTDPAHIWARLQRDKPDVILLDLLMPNIDGFEILSALRQGPHCSAIPVVVLTAKSLAAAEQAEISRLAQGVLTKTQLRREILINTLRRACRSTLPNGA